MAVTCDAGAYGNTWRVLDVPPKRKSALGCELHDRAATSTIDRRSMRWNMRVVNLGYTSRSNKIPSRIKQKPPEIVERLGSH
jgi:hypothetical protein